MNQCAFKHSAQELAIERFSEGVVGWLAGSRAAQAALDNNGAYEATLPHLRSLETKFENVPKRLDSVLPIYFLAFGVGSSEITDTKLINAKIALASYLGAHFHFDTKIVRC
jgi:hypothetical protein